VTAGQLVLPLGPAQCQALKNMFRARPTLPAARFAWVTPMSDNSKR